MPGKSALASADGHLVIIEDNDHGLMADSSVIESLKRHTAGCRTVSQQGDHMVILPQKGSCPGHTQRNGHGIGGVPGNKCIAVAFRRLGEAGNSAKLPQMCKIRPATGQQLMHIRLMTNVKNQAVHHGIKNGFNGDSELHRSKISGQMPAGLTDAGNQKFPDFPAQLFPLGVIQPQKILMAVDFL